MACPAAGLPLPGGANRANTIIPNTTANWFSYMLFPFILMASQLAAGSVYGKSIYSLLRP